MDKVKQLIAFTAVAALAVLAGGWFLVVAPARSEAAELREQVGLQLEANTQLETSLEVLHTKAKGLPGKRAELAEVARRIPPGPALPELLRALEEAASSAGVELTSVVPAPPVAVEPPAAAPAAPAAPAGDAPAPAAAAPAAPVPTGVSSIQLKLVVAGNFYAVEQFVALLEELPRALRVTALSMDPESDALADQPAGRSDQVVRATLTGLVYLAPAQAPAVGGQTAAAGAAVDPVGPPSASAPAS